MTENDKPGNNFIKEIVEADMLSGKFKGKVQTRFPPEPNGYLHIGHAKSMCINFGLAGGYNGKCNLRMDDTNPETEDMEYVEAIKKDIHWLGFEWEDRMFYASDYYEKLYDFAVRLIKIGKAYVCDDNIDQIRARRGTVTQPGKESPFRSRTIEENLDLFRRMRDGEFADGAKVLRAKIDMAHPNMTMRDPIMYRIRRITHYRTGDKWCIYPLYDFAHCFSDSTEGITHSICTLEFETRRELYDWYLDQLGAYHPQQIEFARLNLGHTLLSKRKLLELVEGKHVDGWDDPRMPTLSGIRRRGYTPGSIKKFCETIGVSKVNSVVDLVVLENSIREELNRKAMRVMAVLRPVKVVIINYPEDKEEEFEAVNNPEDPDMGTRKVPFSRVIYIERDDFKEDPPKKFFRLFPGNEVRLRYAYFIKCVNVLKDAAGEIAEIQCTYDPATRGGDSPDGRKVKGTIHWVSAKHAHQAEVRLYDTLFSVREPGDVPEGEDYKKNLNPNSLEVLRSCQVEPYLKSAAAESRYQFERLAYFFVDPVLSKPGAPVFNRIVSLRDTWSKIERA